MSVVFRIGARDWGRCRFAVSALHETTEALRMLRRNTEGRPVPDAPWVHRLLARADPAAYAPLLELLPVTTWGVDFLSPPPRGPQDRFGDELTRVAATHPAQVARELVRCRREQGLPARGENPAAERDALVDLLARAWEELVRPEWPRLRDVLDADVARRATSVAAGGLAALLAGLSPKVTLIGDAVLLASRVDVDVDLDGRGLLLIPTTWGTDASVQWELPWAPTIVYAATGTRTAATAATSTALIALIGRTRAHLLQALDEPATTTGLSTRCGTPLSTTSDHLAVLRAAGLVRTVRRRHALEHRRSPLGDTFIHATSD